MKHILIRNLGPLVEADVELKDVNVVIGPQSSGKSCLLKTASFCTWVEKRIQISQKPEQFAEEGVFVKRLTTFHKLGGYVKADTYIEYETDCMKFSYDHATKSFAFEWKDGRWDYCTPKVSYIPAERNLVAVIPNWFEVKLGDDNIRNFMSDWQKARTSLRRDLPILNLGVAYHYDSRSNSDMVVVDGEQSLDFTNTSSGLQSLIPLFVHLDYLTRGRFTEDGENSVMRQNEYDDLLRTIHNELFEKKGKCISQPQKARRTEDGKMHLSTTLAFREIGNLFLTFTNHEYAEECANLYAKFSMLKRNEIFIEEPEQNLFPPTQMSLIDQIIDCVSDEHQGRLFVATHSPYVVTSFLEKNLENFALFTLFENENGCFIVKTATKEDIQQAYDYSIDVFHNINSFG